MTGSDVESNWDGLTGKCRITTFLAMTHEVLRAKIKDGIPFTMHVADGRSFLVPHHDFIMLPPKATFVVVATPDEENPEEYVSHTIPLLMVSGVDEKSSIGRS